MSAVMLAERVRSGTEALITSHTLTSWCSSPISLVKASLRLLVVGLDTEMRFAGVGSESMRSLIKVFTGLIADAIRQLFGWQKSRGGKLSLSRNGLHKMQ